MKSLLLLVPIVLGILTSTTVSFKKPKAPPLTVFLKDNLFIDEREATNIDYLEYLSWLDEKYGINSDTYTSALPNTTVWRQENQNNAPFVQTYFRHQAYHDYPVVGVSWQQANDYLAWRSDRVYEMYLVQGKIIEYKARDKKFSIDSYLDGTYLGRKPTAEEILPISRYRLPSIEEWEYAASGGVNLKIYPYGLNTDKRKFRKRKSALLNHRAEKDKMTHITAPAYSFLPNDYKIHNMVGNVAEMTAEQSIAKGGSWDHLKEECTVKGQQTYKKATPWLGFRAICEMEVHVSKEGK